MTMEIVDRDSIPSAPKAKGKYEAIVAAVNALQVGKALLIAPPGGCPAEVFRNRLNTSVRPKLRMPEDGAMYVFRVTQDGRVAICYERG